MNVAKSSWQASASARQEPGSQHLEPASVPGRKCPRAGEPRAAPDLKRNLKGWYLGRPGSKRPAWARYGVAMGCVMVSWLMREVLTPVVGPTAIAFTIFFPAVAMAAWYGGLWPGALAATLSAVAANWFFMEPFYELSVKSADLAIMGWVLVSSAFIIGAIEAMHRARAGMDADAAAMSRLYEVGNQCADTNLDYEECLSAILEAAIEITGADKGNIQLLDDESETLKIAAHHGFDEPFLKFFARVSRAEASAYGAAGAAMESAERTVVEDVTQSDIFRGKPSQEVLLQAGVRAVQSTPLVSTSGRVLGMISTHFGTPHRPGEGELRFMDLLTRQAGDYLERKRAEEALRRSERGLMEAQERLRAVLEATGVGLWLNLMPFGKLTWDNATRELFFVPEDVEPTIDLFWSRLHPDDREPTRLAMEAALRDRTLYAIDHRVIDPGSGRVRWVHSQGRGVYNERGDLFRFDGVNYDITERKEFQAELQRLVDERTARLQEFIGELEHVSYTITHDMRAPLRAMRAFSEALKEGSGERLDAEGKMFVEHIITGAERMDALITDTLHYSKTVRTELPMGPVDVGRLLRGMLDTYPQFQEARAEIAVAPHLPLVMGNEAGLTQCFSNLLENALKFAKPGEKARVRVWGEWRDGWVRLWVEDKGIGISKELLPRVFDMFARGSSPEAGTGIGLALVRKVVDRMGGRVGVESEPGGVSRFWVELRRGDVKGDAVRAAA